LPVNAAFAASYGELAAATHRGGRKAIARSFDLIAAKAHAHGARLVTANVNDGDHLGTHDIGPGVQRIEPWSGNAA